MTAPTTPPTMILPNIAPRVADSTETTPCGSGDLSHLTSMRLFERVIDVSPGDLMRQVPLSLLSEQSAPSTGLPSCACACTYIFCVLPPDTAAQPAASTQPHETNKRMK